MNDIKVNKFSETNFYKDHDTTIEELLDYLCKFGLPRLGKTDKGWYAVVDMFVTGVGVSFEIKSGFGNRTPKAALIVCAERLDNTFKKLQKELQNGCKEK